MRTCAITCLLRFLGFRGLRRGAGGGGGGGGGESEDEETDMMSISSGLQSFAGGPVLPVGEGRKRGVLDMRRVGTRDSEDEERLEVPGGG